MQKIHSARKYVSLTGEGSCYGNFYLDYYITKSQIKISDSDIKATVYGVEIEKKLYDDGLERILEQAKIRDVFSSAENTQKLITQLADNLVMPSSLEYIIDDLTKNISVLLPTT